MNEVLSEIRRDSPTSPTGMDMPRKQGKRLRNVRRATSVIGVVAVLGGITFWLSRLDSAPPIVDADLVWIDTVQHGEFIRQVRGNGTLVPKTEWWIASTVEGRVEQILVEPGESVLRGESILVLSNAVLDQSAREAEWAVSAAEAELEKQEAQLNSQLLEREESAVTLAAQLKVAKLEAGRDQQLFDEGILAQHTLDTSWAKYEEFEKRHALADRRVEHERKATDAQLKAQQAQIEQMRGQLKLKQEQLAELQVASKRDGVVKQIMVEEGQQVAAALSLARLARPNELRAEIRIGQNQARDLVVGLPALVDTHNGIVAGRVSRIDPAVEDGTVEVEVDLEGELPKGARPDLSVEGTIELERVGGVVHMGRPVSGREHAEIELFRLTDDGEAVRTRVRLGRASVNQVEVIAGLDAGDRIILSDMSRWESVDRIRLR